MSNVYYIHLNAYTLMHTFFTLYTTEKATYMSNIYYTLLNANIFTLYTPEKATKIVSSTIFIHSLFIDSF